MLIGGPSFVVRTSVAGMIRTLAVENYRSLRRLVLPLGGLTVITGANGSGKSSVYRSLRLLADAARDGAIAALAAEGGLPSTMWAGPQAAIRSAATGHRIATGTRPTGPTALRLGFAGDDLGYAVDFGHPVTASPTMFALDPEIKREWVWAGPSPRPSAQLADRHNSVVRVRDAGGAWAMITQGLRTFDSMLTELADPRAAPELMVVREQMRSWRFYDHVRTDALAPARASHIGTRTPVLSPDGGDLAAALQTIREIGDAAGLRAAVDGAFPGGEVQIEVLAGRFELLMRQQGLLRPLRSPELSDWRTSESASTPAARSPTWWRSTPAPVRSSSTKTPSTPADPADGFLTGIDKILDLIGAAPAEISAILHGTTVATNQLLQGKVGSLGFITTDRVRVDAGDRPAVRTGRVRQLLLLGEARPDRARRPGPHGRWSTRLPRQRDPAVRSGVRGRRRAVLP